MAEGVFWVFRDKDDPRDIHCKLASEDIQDVPEDQAALRDEVDRTLMVLRIIFPKEDPKFEEYFRPLLSLAQFGLVGKAAQPKVANRTLTILREQIVAQEGGRIKNRYMKDLGYRALGLGLVATLAALALDRWCPSLKVLAHFLFLWAGCMAGVWLSFGARKRVLQFEDLYVLEQDRLEPVVRLVFAGGLTVILGLLFSTKTLVVALGSFQSWEFVDLVQVAVLLGLLSGFSELALSTKVEMQATQILRLKS